MQQPAGRPLHHPAQLHPQLRDEAGVQFAHPAQQHLRPADVVDRPGGELGADHVRHVGAGLGRQAVVGGDPLGVHETVDRHRCDDLAGEGVAGHRRGEPLPHRAGEVGHQPVGEVGVLRQVGGQHPLLQRDLGVGEQDGQLGAGEARPAGDPLGHLVAARQVLQLPVQEACLLEPPHPDLVLAGQLRRPGLAVRQGQVLVGVVTEDELGHLVGHRGQQRVPLFGTQLSCGQRIGQQDLEVHLVVGRVDAGGVVDEVGVDPAPRGGVLDPAALGPAKVAALDRAPGADLAAVHPDRIVGPVAHLGAGLGRALHIGSDAAVEQQVDGCLQDGPDQVARHQVGDLGGQPERLTDLRADRHPLGRARVDPAARREQAAVVVGPAGARQLEQPPPLGVAHRRVRVGVEEDVPVVEGGHQPDVLGGEHPVAEHIPRHVTDPRHREVGGGRVDAELVEVAPHRLPGAAGCDPHPLVVVAAGSAGGEGVAQPVAAGQRDRVGEVGEGGRALVGCDHEVRVVPVVAQHARRRLHHAAAGVVGDAQQGVDEDPVAGLALGLPGSPVHRRVRQPLGDEAALGPDRHDHGVLHGLGLHQAEHLGAEVLLAVRPAQAAAGHLAEAQVDALDTRGVDEDLVGRPRLRQQGQFAGQDLVGQRLGPREGVGPHGGPDHRQEHPDDPVVVQTRHGVDARLEPRVAGGQGLGAGLPLGVRVGVELGREGLHQPDGDLRVGVQRGGDVLLAEADPCLQQVAGDPPQPADLFPGEPRGEDQPVEQPRLAATPPRRLEGVHEALPRSGVPVGRGRGVGGQPESEVVEQHPAAAQVPLVGSFVDDIDAEHAQVRHHPGQLQRLQREHRQPDVGGVLGVERLPQHEPQVVLAGELVGDPQFLDRDVGRRRLLVGLGELDAPGLTRHPRHGGQEGVLPGAGGGLDPFGDPGGVRRARLGGRRGQPDHEEQPGEQ